MCDPGIELWIGRRVILGAIVLASAAGSAGSAMGQRIIPPTDRPYAELEIVLDEGHHPADVASYAWIGDQPRLILHPDAGAHGLHTALRQLLRRLGQCSDSFVPNEEVLELRLDLERRETFDGLWDYLVNQPYQDLVGHAGQVRTWTAGISFRPWSEELRRREGVICSERG